MCGRYVPPTVADIERAWRIDRSNWHDWMRPIFNLAPTMQSPVLLPPLEDGEGRSAAPLRLLAARWGLVPHWWSRPAMPALTFNARSEEARQKPMWRDALRGQRCLMPALGWYEWNEQEPVFTSPLDAGESGAAKATASGKPPAGKRPMNKRPVSNQPYFIRCPDSPVVAMAGLWSSWNGPTGAVLSCALLSKEAAPAIASIHHRMPVVLRPEDQAAWLDAATPLAEVDAIIARARQDLAGHRVSTRVNSVRSNDANLLDEVPPQAQPGVAPPAPKDLAQAGLFGD